jgi:hypothetical protein
MEVTSDELYTYFNFVFDRDRCKLNLFSIRISKKSLGVGFESTLIIISY